ncbi:hypothetical protein [Streptomyces morookaense]|uniref:Uncharacterized protein n=1 Tax=Streptomyces morookaense TaxID=1970 RepID=A0A7Y7B6N1_STRMO|nr:hypothetical protein [Streptomyces morookaense]NVK80016.1 hypothetical protein [Streptomyces morookaense]
MFLVGRPIDPAWRDKAALVAGVVVAIVVGVIGLGAGAEPPLAWSAAVLWGASILQGTHLARSARAGRTSASR